LRVLKETNAEWLMNFWDQSEMFGWMSDEATMRPEIENLCGINKQKKKRSRPFLSRQQRVEES